MTSRTRQSEFDIIRMFTPPGEEDEGVRVGIGDDAAVLREQVGRDTLVTKDLLVEDVHFRLHTTTPFQLGWKSMAVNVSDIAAMGGTPAAAFLGLAIPPGLGEPFLEAFRDGLQACADHYGVRLLGGDTCGSRAGLTISVTLLGYVEAGRAVTRGGARPGDLFFLGGPVGDSAAGLYLLEGGGGQGIDGGERERLIRAHLEPSAQVELGRLLCRGGFASAMLDVSDGVLQDLSHICRESRVGARLFAEAIPMSSGARALAEGAGVDPATWALSGGEDYVLLFTVPPAQVETMAREVAALLGARLEPVGEITSEPAMVIREGGRETPVEPLGWDHFRGGSPRRP